MADSGKIDRINADLGGCMEGLDAAIGNLGESSAAARVIAAREALAVVVERAKAVLEYDAAEVADRVGGQPPIHRDGMVCIQY